MQTSVLGNYFKLKTTLGIISWKFLGLKLRYILQKFKGSLLRFSSGSNLFMTGWTLNWTLGSVQQKFWTLSLVQEVQVQTLVQNWTSSTLEGQCRDGDLDSADATMDQALLTLQKKYKFYSSACLINNFLLFLSTGAASMWKYSPMCQPIMRSWDDIEVRKG